MAARLVRGLPFAAILLGCGPPAAPPHILWITADALRADHLSCNGYARETSPAIDAFATRASNFVQAVTVIPKTAPSFATMFTGRHPAEHGLLRNRGRIPGSLPLLAEILRDHGYRTAAFVSNPALVGSRGFDRGFDVYRLLPAEAGVARVNASFRAWAAADWERPSFAWLHYIDPHGPYTPPPAFDGLFADDALDRDDRRVALSYEPLPGFNRNKILGAVPAYQRRGDEDRVADYARRYDQEIRYVDHAFAEVIALLEERGVYDGSAVFFLSDHGESLGEHELYFEHGWFAHDATLRVPLLLKAPFQREGRTVASQVSTLDLFPTVLGLAGIQHGPVGLGRDLLGAAAQDRPVAVRNSGGYPVEYRGLRETAWKLLVEQGSGRAELYRLDGDPGETVDRSELDPELLQNARARMERLWSGLRPAPAEDRPEAPLDPDLARQLRALGYAD